MKIKASLILFLFFALLVGCAETQSDGHSEELAPYIAALKLEYFEITGDVLDTDVPINIKNLDGTQRGLCRKAKGINKTVREIYIDREVFEEHKGEENYITTILLHEIGHCVYGLDHDESLTDFQGFSIPRTVMYRSTQFIIPQMKKLKNYYYKEFRNRALRRN